MTDSSNKHAMLAFVCSVVVAGSAAVHAQSVPDESAAALEEIVVTAERRESNVQKTGVAVSVRSGAALREEGKFSTRQILEDVPGVAVTDPAGMFAAGSDTQGNNIVIRGVPSNGGISALAQVPTTAVYVDGIYEGLGGGYDIDRVEVLRGPQGTLYGRSATSGVVSIHTRDPQLGMLAGDAAAELGNYSLQHYTGALNIPLGDTFAIRVAANEYKRQGYYNGDGGAFENTSARAKLLYKPSEDLSVLVGAATERNRTHTGGATGGIPSPGAFEYTPAPVYPGTNTFHQYWADINLNVGVGTLSYLPALRTWDQSATEYFVGPGGGGLYERFDTPFDQFVTQELRLASNPGEKLLWLIGTFYYDNRLQNANTVQWLSSRGLLADAAARRETKDYGIFGELTYPLTNSTRLTAGARYDYTYVRTDELYTTNINLFCNTPISPGFPGCPAGPPESPSAGLPESNVSLVVGGSNGTRRFYNLTYKLRLEHDLTSANMIYGMISSGFLPGDVQITTGNGNTPVVNPFKEEQLISYEVGSKNRFLADKLQVNASVYYYRYGGFQQVVTFDVNNPSSVFTAVVPARMKGGELEMLYQVTTQDRIGLSYAYTDAYYVDKPAYFAASVPKSHIAGVTPHTVNASYDHTFALPGGSTFVAHADARFLSEHAVASASSDLLAQGGEAYIRVDDQVIGDLSGTWNAGSGKYSVTGYARNIGDNRYMTSILLQGLTPLHQVTGTQYDPRTYGLVVAVHF